MINKILLALPTAKFSLLREHPAAPAYCGAEGENAMIAETEEGYLIIDNNGILLHNFDADEQIAVVFGDIFDENGEG